MFVFVYLLFQFVFFFFKQKTAYDMLISDWSSDVFSSDLSIVTTFRSGCRKWNSWPDIVPMHGQRLAVETEILAGPGLAVIRSEERRVGTECVSTCRSWW